jgi:hypothetical protein
MSAQDKGKSPIKTRFNRSRYFFVASEGWYLEAREGIQGPFVEMAEAIARLTQLKEQTPLRRVEVW